MFEHKFKIDGFTDYVRKAAADGAVLLKNNNNTLPIKKNEEIALFGRCQIDYYRSGTGSGGSVNVPYTVNALEGIKNNKDIRYNRYLADLYKDFVQNNPFDNGGGEWAAEPWFQKEMPLTDELVSKSFITSDKAIIIIGRTAGEEQDNDFIKGSYCLTDIEEDMIDKVSKVYNKVTVVLNVSNIIDMSWQDKVSAILYSWQGGIEGGNALADIISGRVTPSGKLIDTIASNIDDYPSNKNFGDSISNKYQEDIYLGYRYFETFNRDAVLYHFGFGLSYTEFIVKEISSTLLNVEKDPILSTTFSVQNIGSQYSGKEVVQLYYSAPQGKLGKPVKELGAFAKTKELRPGEIQQLTLELPIKQIASYDDTGVTGNPFCYILEEGDYKFYIGNSINNLKKLESLSDYSLNEDIVVEQLNEACCPQISFDRIKPKINPNGSYSVTYEAVPTRKGDLKKRILDWCPKDIIITGDRGIKLTDVKNGTNTLDEFIAQLSKKDLETIVRGEGMSSPKVTSGTAGAFGGVGDSLLKLGIPLGCVADGPSGIRRDSGEIAVQIPIGTLLASSWDVSLVKELYTFVGKELVLNEIDSLLGPGINIHRHPLNGRNFEYFSEDPYLTGEMAKAVTLGLKDGGSTGTVKHFACNDQEHNRAVVDSVVSERALREIHLKPFEMVVKEGDASSIMTAYNPINGIWTASNYDLNTTILRKEWGYKGIVMTDWWAKMNDPVVGGVATPKQTASMVKAQNDIYMLVNNFGAEVNSFKDDISEALNSGRLSIGELQQCGKNICNFLINSKAIDRPIILGSKVVECKSEIDNSENQLDIGQELLIESKTDFKLKLIVDKPGEYDLVTYMKYDANPSAQSACTLFLNSKYITNIQLNGTFGNSVKEKNIKVRLDRGSYTMDLKFTKPGLEIHSISFILN